MYHRISSAAAADPTLWLLSNGRRGRAEWPDDPAAAHRVVDHAEANGLAPVLWRLAEARRVELPHAIRERMGRVHDRAELSTQRAAEWVTRLDDALTGAGIYPVWLKGAAWGAALYRDLGPRPMRDLDLVVAPEALDAAVEVVDGLGFHTEPGAPAALQHLPRLVHEAEPIRIDLHHRLLPRRIYGFDVSEPSIAMAHGRGRDVAHADETERLFHLIHMVLHAFHHSFYNLRLLHLFDIHLAREQWSPDPDLIQAALYEYVPPAVADDLWSLVEQLFGTVGSPAVAPMRPRAVAWFLCNGSAPLTLPVTRIRNPGELARVAWAEGKRAWFWLTRSPGRFGRRPAALHPPGSN